MMERVTNAGFFGDEERLRESIFAFYPSLCGNRNILNTLQLVQAMSNIYKDNESLQLKPGSFGSMWKEARGPCNAIAGDLDELLMGQILPVLLPLGSLQKV